MVVLITISTRRGCNSKGIFPLLVSFPFTTRVTQMAYFQGWIHAIRKFYSNKQWISQPCLSRCIFLVQMCWQIVIFVSGQKNSHGFHLLQAMKFTVEEINNSSGPQSLLPGLKLGYQMYDSCTVSAALLSAIDVLNYWRPSTFELHPNYNGTKGPVAVVGPDSSSKTFTAATLLGSYLIPQVSVALAMIQNYTNND